MIKLENYEVMGWKHAIRGMRNPMNSWEKSDSYFNLDCDNISCEDCPTRGRSDCVRALDMQKSNIGPNDHDLMMRLRNAGTDHRKFMRMITVYVDITAPLYWWKEFDTYKVGTTVSSCSTMHKIHEKEFTMGDFSYEYLDDMSLDALERVINILNYNRRCYNDITGKDQTTAKHFWWQMIQLLPSSYNQKRTVMLNYEVLANIYKSRKNHKLTEWVELCKWIEEKLPYSELITGKKEVN